MKAKARMWPLVVVCLGIVMAVGIAGGATPAEAGIWDNNEEAGGHERREGRERAEAEEGEREEGQQGLAEEQEREAREREREERERREAEEREREEREQEMAEEREREAREQERREEEEREREEREQEMAEEQEREGQEREREERERREARGRREAEEREREEDQQRLAEERERERREARERGEAEEREREERERDMAEEREREEGDGRRYARPVAPLHTGTRLDDIPGIRQLIKAKEKGADQFCDLPPASITVTSPVSTELLYANKTYAITWKKKGVMSSKVNIMCYQDGTIPGPGYSSWYAKLSCHIIAKGVPNNGTYKSAIGISFLEGPVRFRVQTIDDMVYGESGVIMVGDPGIKITSPAQNSIWMHANTCQVEWTTIGQLYPLFDLSLHPMDYAGKPDFSTTVWSEMKSANVKLLKWEDKPTVSLPGSPVQTVRYYRYEWKIPVALANADYALRVRAHYQPKIQGASRITLFSKVSSGTGYLQPAKPDLIPVQLLYVAGPTSTPSFVVKVQNKGADYSGKLKIKYSLVFYYINGSGKAKKVSYKGTVAKSSPPKVFQESGEHTTMSVTVKGVTATATNELSAPFYTASSQTMPSPWGLTKDFYPDPLYVDATVTITVLSGKEENDKNNTIQGGIVRSKMSDIAVGNSVKLYSKGGGGLKTMVLTKNKYSFNANDLKWTTLTMPTGTFEIDVYAPVMNLGGTFRTFKCYLYVDKQPGQLVGTFSLKPGENGAIMKTVKIKLADVQDVHEFCIIADQSEETSQAYPGAYLNNFFYTKFTVSVPVTGVGP